MAVILKNLHNDISLSLIPKNYSDKIYFVLQNYMKMTIKSSKSKPDVEFPYGVRLFSKCESGSISAID